MPARNRPFSLEQKAQVAALRGEGRSVAEIAGIIGRNYKSVENLITREGYRSQPVAPPEPVSSFQLDVPVRPFAVRVPTPPPSKDGKVFTALVYGDSHVPFHDSRALDIVKSIAKAEQPDVILNVGDLVDSWQISRFDKDPTRQDSLQDNIDEARQHLAELALLSPRSRRVLLEGNHEARLARTIWRMEGAARELPKLRVFQQQMTWPKLLETDAIGWEWIGEREQSRTSVLPKLITKHGTVVRKWSGTTARGEWEKYGHSGLSGHCFDNKTEALTRDRGWVSHESLSEGDIILGYDQTLRKTKWVPVQAVYRYDHFDHLFTVRGRAVSLAVTAEHGLLARRANDIAWATVTARQAYGRALELPLAAPVESAPAPLSDGQVKTLAWIMAEGGWSLYKGNISHIRVYQSDLPDGRCAALEQALTDAGISFTKKCRPDIHRKWVAYKYSLSQAGWKTWLPEYLEPDKTPTSSAFAGFDARQSALFLQEYAKGDGTALANGMQLAAYRQSHIDVLQMLAAKAGWRTSTSVGRSWVAKRTGEVRSMRYLTINYSGSQRVQDSAWRIEPYSGTVWCVSVPTGALLVRRGGHTVITHNTHRLGEFLHRDHNGTASWIETGCTCDLDPPYGTDFDWQQGCVFIVWNKDRRLMQAELVKIRDGSALFQRKTIEPRKVA